MRILHTSDWHLGQRFHSYDRLAEQREFLEWLGDQVEEQAVDALLVVGDVFDTVNPSNEAKGLYYKFLARLAEYRDPPQVVVVAGNHDSGALLDAPSDLLRVLNVHVRGTVRRVCGEAVDYSQFEVPLRGRDGVEALCLAVPFLRPSDCPSTEELHDSTRLFYEELGARYAQARVPVVCTGHLFAMGASNSTGTEAEVQRRGMVVGSLERIGVGDFSPSFSYVALGHIHRSQRLTLERGGEVWYSGSPYATTFGEQGVRHGVLLVDISGEGNAVVQQLPYESRVKLHVAEGSKEEILSQFAAVEEGEADSFAPMFAVRCVVREPEPSLGMELTEATRGKYMRLGPIRTERESRRGGEAVESAQVAGLEVEDMAPISLAEEAFRREFQAEMSGELRALFVEIASSLGREGETQ